MAATPQGEAKPLAFVIMPFDEEFKAIFDQLLVPPLEEAGFCVERADSSLDQENILKAILRGIADSEVVIADLTTRNPNVLYELGLAHGLKKATILVAQSIEDIPFDLRPYRANIYSLDFRQVGTFKERLHDLATRLLSGEIRFSNPVTDFLVLTAGSTTHAATELQPADKAEAPAALEEATSESGFLDWVADAEEGAEQATASLQKTFAAMNVLSEHVSRRAEEMKNARAAGGPGTASRVRALAAAMARDILDFVNIARAELPTYHTSWERFAESIASLLTSPLAHDAQHRQSLSELRHSVAEALQNADGAARELEKVQDPVRALRGTSRDMNLAVDRLLATLREITTEIETSKASLTKIVGLLDEILEAAAS